jgi:hypothetical protein
MSKTDLETAIEHAACAIEHHLVATGKWCAAQEAAAHRFGETPIIGNQGTHLCRESSMFARNMLAAAGFEGWEIENGQVSLEDIDNLPLEIQDLVDGDDAPSVAHTWLINREAGLLLDMTASQFGYEFHPEEEPMLLTLQQADNYYQADDEQQDWYDPDLDLAETVGAWLNLGDGVPATRESQPQGRRPLSPIEEIAQAASGQRAPEGYDPIGAELMSLLEELREIRQDLLKETAPAAG